MIEIKIEDKEIKDMLNTLLYRLNDMSPVMMEVSEDMRDAVEENFEQEGRPKWKALSPKTIEQRRKKGYWPGNILIQEGNLVRSIEASHSKDEAVVGTNLKYAAIHQFGGMAGRKHKVKIPARPYLKLTDSDIERIKKKIMKYLVR